MVITFMINSRVPDLARSDINSIL